MDPLDLTLNLWTPQPNPVPLPGLALRTSRTAISVTHTVEQGHESLTVGGLVERDGALIDAWLPRQSLEWRALAHVLLADGAQPLWAGRLTVPEYAPGGWLRGFTAHGYWDLLDRELFTDSATATRTSADVIRSVLAANSTTSWIEIGNASQWADPGVSFAMASLTNASLAEIVNQVVTAGGTDNNQWDVQLWTGGAARVLAHLASRTRPDFAAARFSEPWDGLVDLAHDDREIATHVRVRHTVAGVETFTDWYPDLTDTSIQDRYGIPRQRVQIDGGELTATLASQYGKAYWTEFSRRRWSGTLERVGGLSRTRGLIEPGRTVRAGEWLHIEGLPSTESPLLIHRVEWESEGDRLRVTLGPGLTDESALIEALRRQVAALGNDRSPATGARR